MFYRVVPLSAGFMLTSIVGFLVTIFYVYPYIGDKFPGSTWMNSLAFSIMLFFVIMFIAAMVSMTLAPLDAEFDVRTEKNRQIKKK